MAQTKRRVISAQDVPIIWRATPSPKDGFRSLPEGATGFFDIDAVRAELEAEAEASASEPAHEQG